MRQPILLLLAATLVLVGFVPTSLAQDTPPSLITLSPGGEKRMTQFISDLQEKRDKIWMGRMNGEIASIAKLTSLNDAGVATLKKAAEPIVAEYSKEWAKDTDKELRRTLLVNNLRENDLLDQLQLATEMIASNDRSSTTPPSLRDDWINAVHAVLTPAQGALWDKERADKEASLLVDIQGALDPSIKAIQGRSYLAALQRCHQIEAGFVLDDGQKKKLEDAARTASEQSARKWKDSITAMVYVMDDKNRNQFVNAISMGNVRMELGDDPTLNFDSQPAWKSVVATVLTSAQQEEMSHLSDDSTAERADVIAMAFVAILDQRLAFTPEQREKLTPLAVKLVKGDTFLCPKDGKYQAYNANYLYDLSKKATDADLAGILDSTQLARWRKLDARQDGPTPTPPPDVSPNESTPQAIDQEPEHVEEMISRKMYEEEQYQRKTILDSYSLKAEEVIRILNPKPELSEKLQIAVLGMGEKQLASWKSRAEQQLRNQLNEVDPDTIDEEIIAVQRSLIRFARGQVGNGIEQQWKSVLKDTFTPAQLEVLKKDTEARQDFLYTAETGVILDDFCHEFALDKDQAAKLKPIFEKVMKDYGPDSYTFFQGVNGSTPWFLTPSFEFTPMIGVSDDDMKKVLNADQVNSWIGSNEHANGASYWQQFQQLHQNRMQRPQDLGALGE